ncbi:hypothetical protein COEREDRAFT_6276 [Coemansia reversa NRRL 1564]|uniref:Uncharacterized protein n=1 Tax=Coemansia reversa (strain ATCC 12441 / NRRL 1564) TaxID=763665 RepID=A0A2G5BHQ9_COERN|nr:hypothetical protein COEREDRAFT_6276 [Coemansia reversa NRRL 1564]|eukprot:PIA18558.1 hypothetical protein COEREDRAFT_6276 [Coemansia reversa NRRL 1564]
MKICYQSVLQVATVAALSFTCALAIPDTPGTKTFVISLATTDNGQLVPVVLSSNSNGFETVTMPDTSDVSLDAQDSDADIQYLENSSILDETSADEQAEPSESADLGIAEITTQEGEAAYDSDSDAEDNDNADPASKDSDSSGASSHFSDVLILSVALGISSIATMKF